MILTLSFSAYSAPVHSREHLLYESHKSLGFKDLKIAFFKWSTEKKNNNLSEQMNHYYFFFFIQQIVECQPPLGKAIFQ